MVGVLLSCLPGCYSAREVKIDADRFFGSSACGYVAKRNVYVECRDGIFLLCNPELDVDSLHGDAVFIGRDRQVAVTAANRNMLIRTRLELFDVIRNPNKTATDTTTGFVIKKADVTSVWMFADPAWTRKY